MQLAFGNVGVVATREADRLAALRSLNILDTPSEERFDRLTRIAAAAFDAPISTVTLIDEDRQWHKACLGVSGREDDRAVSFCAVAIERPEPMVVNDACEDPRFADNRLVTGPPHIRFYAGQPITTVDGFRVGTLCVIDTRPREFTADQIALLQDLARIAEDELNHKELSEALAAWRESEQRFRAVFDAAAIGIVLVEGTGRVYEVIAAWAAMLGLPADELRGQSSA
jgi:GAF domain-containing protein